MDRSEIEATETAGLQASSDAEAFDVDLIEPGRPSAENVAFVLLGVLGALYVVAQIAGLV